MDAAILYTSGLEIPEVASRLGMSESEVFKIIKRRKIKFRRGGWRPSAGRKPTLKAPHGAPPKIDNSAFYNQAAERVPKCFEVLDEALEAMKYMKDAPDSYAQVPDWTARLEATRQILAKLMGDVRAIEFKPPKEGASSYDLAIRFRGLDAASIQKEHLELLRSLGGESETP